MCIHKRIYIYICICDIYIYIHIYIYIYIRWRVDFRQQGYLLLASAVSKGSAWTVTAAEAVGHVAARLAVVSAARHAPKKYLNPRNTQGFRARCLRGICNKPTYFISCVSSASITAKTEWSMKHLTNVRVQLLALAGRRVTAPNGKPLQGSVERSNMNRHRFCW